jgi:hypothetical protein
LQRVYLEDRRADLGRIRIGYWFGFLFLSPISTINEGIDDKING